MNEVGPNDAAYIAYVLPSARRTVRRLDRMTTGRQGGSESSTTGPERPVGFTGTRRGLYRAPPPVGQNESTDYAIYPVDFTARTNKKYKYLPQIAPAVESTSTAIVEWPDNVTASKTGRREGKG